MKGTEAINKRAKFIEHHTVYDTQRTTNSCRFGGKNNNREMAVKQENNDACTGIDVMRCAAWHTTWSNPRKFSIDFASRLFWSLSVVWIDCVPCKQCHSPLQCSLSAFTQFKCPDELSNGWWIRVPWRGQRKKLKRQIVERRLWRTDYVAVSCIYMQFLPHQQTIFLMNFQRFWMWNDVAQGDRCTCVRHHKKRIQNKRN